MKILFLTKFSEVEHYLFHFTKKIHAALPVEVDILHVVNAYPQIPLKHDGTIIDQCVDYDLSELNNLKLKESLIANEIKNEYSFIQSAMVEIGNLERIVKHKLSNATYDFIFMGAHQTSLIEDITHETTIERIMELSDTPVLSLKCDQSHNSGIDKIGIFDDFNLSKPNNFIALSKLANAFGSEIHLFKLSNKKSSGEEEMLELEAMKNFAAENDLKNFQIHLLPLNGNSEEGMITENIIKENLNLIAITELHRKTFSWILSKNLKTSIADHILAPLLIY
ncbi:MAG: universal stress protein [Flammeovirgaceae bacterium]|nr:universal stress protein [Flammeovirgaceae bacterium]